MSLVLDCSESDSVTGVQWFFSPTFYYHLIMHRARVCPSHVAPSNFIKKAQN